MSSRRSVLERLSERRFLLAAFILLIVMAASITVWFIATPRWSFSISTDKTTYKLHENVTITVLLKNLGYITHSFRSLLSNPIFVRVDSTQLSHVWYCQFNASISEFSVGSNGLLERTFVWNQTDNTSPWLGNQPCVPGRYYVKAFVPVAEEDALVNEEYVFQAYTEIEITSA